MTREWVKLGLDSDKTQKHSKQRREQWKKYDATPERIAKKAQWYQENKEQIKEKKKLRVRTPEFKIRNVAWKMKRYHEDPVYRAKDILRRQLWWFCKKRKGKKRMVHLQGIAYSNTRGLRVPHYKIRVHSDTRIEHSPDSGLRWVERTNLNPLYVRHNPTDPRGVAGSNYNRWGRRC